MRACRVLDEHPEMGTFAEWNDTRLAVTVGDVRRQQRIVGHEFRFVPFGRQHDRH